MNKSNNCKVSILIPVYNVEAYLPQCIESTLNQTMKEIEIIAVNDGSTDGSLEILRSYEAKDSRMKVISKPNGGYGHAINLAIEASTGEYLIILESDDYIKPNMCSRLYEEAEKYDHQLDFIKSDTIRFWGENADEEKYIRGATIADYGRIIVPRDNPHVYNNYVINVTGLYKSEFIKGNNIRLNESPGAAFQDNGLWFQCYFYANKIAYLNEAFYMYRQDRVDSSTNTASYVNSRFIFGEFDFIHDFMDKNPNRKNAYWDVYSLRMVQSFLYHNNRAKVEYQISHLQEIQKRLLKASEAGELNCSLMNKEIQKQVGLIIADPMAFYYTYRIPATYTEFSKKLVNASKDLYLMSLQVRAARRRATQAESGARPKVSVIMPVYNMQTYLSECLDSVLGQSLHDIEVICIDDGSSDMSLSILANRLEIDDRLIVECQNNQGAGPARNLGLSIARGEYIAFMDSDDKYPSLDVLEKLYDTAVRTDSNICGGSCVILNMSTGKCINADNLTFDLEGMHTFAEEQNDYGFYDYIYKTEFLKAHGITFPPFRRYQDPPFLAEAMLAAKDYYVIPDQVYLYRFIKKGTNASWSEEQVRDLIRGIKYNIDLAHKNGLEKLYYDSVMRLEKSFCKRIVDNSIGRTAVRSDLMRVQSVIDIDMLHKIDPSISDSFVLAPLLQHIVNNDTAMIKMKKEMTQIKASLSKTIGTIDSVQAKKELAQLKANLTEVKGALDSVQASVSFRIGRIFTRPARMIRDILKRQ